MLRFSAFFGAALAVIGCGIFQEPLQHKQVDQSSEWWRTHVPSETVQKIVEAQEEKKRLDSLGLSHGHPIDYGFLISNEQFEEPRAAFALLLNTKWFKSRLTGIAGTPSSHYIAFNTLLDQKDATGIFEDLLERGYRAGQLYALCGLYITNRSLFEANVDKFTTVSDSVRVLRHDMFDKRSVSDIVTEIREGKWPESLKKD
jgi:hypothetical protein